MITVNLIPRDMHRRQRTPPGQFVAVLLAVTAAVSSLAVLAYLRLGRLVEERSRLRQVEAELAALRADKTYAEQLMAELKEYRRRTGTIQGIAAARVLWSQKLDELWAVIDNKGNRERHLVWLTQLAAKSPRRRGKKGTPGRFTLAGYSASEESKKLSDFHRDLVESPFFAGFSRITDPQGQLVEFKDDREPRAAWRFDFHLIMPPRPLPTRGKGLRRGKAANQGGKR